MTLLKCPFCGSRPYAETHAKKHRSFTSCANKDCEIFGVRIDTRKWNSRHIGKANES